MKIPISDRGRSPSRTLDSLQRDYLKFSTLGGGNIKNTITWLVLPCFTSQSHRYNAQTGTNVNQPVSIKYALGCITRTPHLPGDIHEVVAADGERVPPAWLGAGPPIQRERRRQGWVPTVLKLPSLNLRRRVRRKRSTSHESTVHAQAQNVDVHLLQFICIYRFGSHACPLFKLGDTCARGYQWRCHHNMPLCAPWTWSKPHPAHDGWPYNGNGTERFSTVLRKRNVNFFLAPTVHFLTHTSDCTWSCARTASARKSFSRGDCGAASPRRSAITVHKKHCWWKVQWTSQQSRVNSRDIRDGADTIWEVSQSVQ